MRLHRNGLWREPDFLKLWAGQTISLIGSQIGASALRYTAIMAGQRSGCRIGLGGLLGQTIGLQSAITIGVLVGALAAVRSVCSPVRWLMAA